MKFTPRPSQLEILKYKGGTMGIPAVPGAGKTYSLSALAVKLVTTMKDRILDPDQEDGQEVLVVTFSNAAVSNFSSRIASMLSEQGMIPNVGYRVCTLHSMAMEIIRGHFTELGLDPESKVLDAEVSSILLSEVIQNWLKKDDRRTFDQLAKNGSGTASGEDIYKGKWADDLKKILGNVISQAKDYLIRPEQIAEELEKTHTEMEALLLQMIYEVYSAYQTQLRAFPAMDFADLMFYAHQILENDKSYLEHLQRRWPYILEDEAQDSSMIQEKVLSLLTAKSHNWVRVGDTNQAINETFTTADPKYLKNFLSHADRVVELKEAGRSAPSVIKQANRLIRWVSKSYPESACRGALNEPYIHKTKEGDAQGNPKDAPERIVYDCHPYSAADEIEVVCRLAIDHAQKNPTETLAILVPGNELGKKFAEHLEKSPVEVIEVLRSTKKSRNTAETLSKVLSWLSRPLRMQQCRELFEDLYGEGRQGEFFLLDADRNDILDALEQIMKAPEAFFFPFGEETVNDFDSLSLNVYQRSVLLRFSYFLKHWLANRFTPINQLLLLIAQDIFDQPEDLTTSGQLAIILEQHTRMKPELRLSDYAEELKNIQNNASLNSGLRDSEVQFDPELYRGKIVLTTYHKSKGLEWDQVFLTSANSYDFPSGILTQGTLKAFPIYIRDGLSLQAELLEVLKLVSEPETAVYVPGEASRRSYIDRADERLRLLYVGITRAKKGLYISWNNGTNNSQRESIAVTNLRKEWEQNGKIV